MIWVAVALLCTTLLAAWIAYNFYKKYQKTLTYCEAYIQLFGECYLRVKSTVDDMNAADRLGAFAADDEVGHTFKELLSLQTDLYTFLTKYVNQEDSAAEGEEVEEEVKQEGVLSTDSGSEHHQVQ